MLKRRGRKLYRRAPSGQWKKFQTAKGLVGVNRILRNLKMKIRYVKIGIIEKEYGVQFNVDPNMRLIDYLKKNKLKSMSKALEKLNDTNKK